MSARAVSQLDDLVDLYGQLLERVEQAADQIGNRPIASHGPFRGSQYNGLVIVGRALHGWDAAETPARWYAHEATMHQGRQYLLDRTRSWAEDRPEPIAEVAERSNRRGTAFWRLSRRLVEALHADATGPCYSHYAWWNLFPLGCDRPGGSPTGALWTAQHGLVGDVFRTSIEWLNPRQVITVAGRAA